MAPTQKPTGNVDLPTLLASKKTRKQKKIGPSKASRMYVRGIVTGYKRSKANQYPNTSLIRIEGLSSKEDVPFYLGKRVAYVYTAKTVKNGSKYRVIWGLIRRSHGNGGLVRAHFRRNLPPHSFGKKVRVMLYPSSI